MVRLRTGVVTALVLAVELVTVVVLHRLGSIDGLEVRWGDVRGWLADSATDDVLVALVRVAALALAWWLLASTVLYLTARVLRLRRLAQGLHWATLPGVRRLIDGVVAGSIVAGAALTGAGPASAQAQTSTPAYVPRPAGDAPAYTPVPAGNGDLVTTVPQAPATTSPATTAGPVLEAITPAATEPPTPARSVSASAPHHAVVTHEVERGDNLWTLAERQLAAATGRPIADLNHEQLRAYWLRLVEANLGLLASGDPDLIYSDEVIVLPDVVQP